MKVDDNRTGPKATGHLNRDIPAAPISYVCRRLDNGSQ